MVTVSVLYRNSLDDELVSQWSADELAAYWRQFDIQGEVLETLQRILYDFGENAAAVATDIVLLMQSEQRGKTKGHRSLSERPIVDVYFKSDKQCGVCCREAIWFNESHGVYLCNMHRDLVRCRGCGQWVEWWDGECGSGGTQLGGAA